LTGYLLGVMTVGLLWLKAPLRDNAGWIGVEPESGEPVAAGRAVDGGKEQTRTTRKPHFDFYTMLPAMEVVIPEQELHETPPAAASSARPSAPGPLHLLQVGSFRKQADAERLKAQLALLGYGSQIQKAEGPQDVVWYRVRTSPFETVAALRKARQQLEANGYRSLVIQASR
jgi:cell division protein FtsN